MAPRIQAQSTPAGPFSGTIPADANPDVGRMFESLLELRWREVSFPYVELTTELRQDLAPHKFADRDGAHIEGTGRAPLQITARVPCLVGIDAGPNEHWQRPLYPFTWRKLFEACAQRGSGTLQHPELGDITCKLETMRTRWEANVRSGVYVDITWIESDDTGIDLDQDLAQPSPLASIQAAANDLDTYLATFDPSQIPQFPPVLASGFDDLVQGIRGAVDQTTLLQAQFGGKIAHVLYEAQTVEDSLSRAVNQNALNWPLVDACERAKSAAYDLKKLLLTKGRPVAFYKVPKDSTLAQVAASIPAAVGDLITLNQAYVASPLITAGSVVRYYRQAA